MSVPIGHQFIEQAAFQRVSASGLHCLPAFRLSCLIKTFKKGTIRIQSYAPFLPKHKVHLKEHPKIWQLSIVLFHLPLHKYSDQITAIALTINVDDILIGSKGNIR